ncbi:leucine-rich repeat-containing protein 63-like isoform X2 [Heterodontus francisci]|uniref:leucine-rich repeat-containing protein 63-like isoform X2 n=1 Tax=Heterodontus francisci TaxID=7792 RepID=UPI00355C1E93
MSKHPELLRRPLPPKDAFPPKSCEPRSRPPDTISTKKASAPDGEYKKERDSTNHPDISCRSSGPSGFPSRIFIAHRQHDPHFAEDDLQYNIPNEFTLEDFFQEPSATVPPLETKTIVLSRYNYKKIVKLLASKLWNQNQEKVNIVELPIDDIPVVLRRIPQRQHIIEMIAASRNQEHFLRYGASPELLNYPGAVLNVEGRKEFLESADTESSIMEEDPERRINPYQFLILRILAVGGDSLNLRGHFIHQLPDLTALVSMLKYLNLSFNNFEDIPAEIYRFSRLEMLNLRDNPIKEISSDIAKLTNLRIFNISFCLVSVLPAGKLQYLNVEGNELITLPCGLLQLQLKHVRVANNYMHPLFWEKNARNQPQQLTHLAALTFSKNHLSQQYTNITKEVQDILNNATICDCCKGPLYGPGLHLIQPQKTIFNTESLPFLFHACSPSCYKWFVSKAH